MAPWVPGDAKGHTKKASSPVAQRQWAHVANGLLKSGRPEGEAIREANAVVAKRKKKKGAASKMMEALQ